MGTFLTAAALLLASAAVVLAALAAARALDADRRFADLRASIPARASLAASVLGWCGVAAGLAGFLGLLPGVQPGHAALPLLSISLLGFVLLAVHSAVGRSTAAGDLSAADTSTTRRAA